MGPGNPSFDRERFVSDCTTAYQIDGMNGVHEVLASAVSNPREVLAAFGEPTQAGLDVMHSSPHLTILAAHWTPQMNLLPHDHLMAALIGIFTGREDNIFWRRSEEGLKAFGAECLFEGDIVSLPADVIHSVTNPLPRFTSGIHIYEGDFFATKRHQWDAETLMEQPSDGNAIRAMFARENKRYQASHMI